MSQQSNISDVLTMDPIGTPSKDQVNSNLQHRKDSPFRPVIVPGDGTALIILAASTAPPPNSPSSTLAPDIFPLAIVHEYLVSKLTVVGNMERTQSPPPVGYGCIHRSFKKR